VTNLIPELNCRIRGGGRSAERDRCTKGGHTQGDGGKIDEKDTVPERKIRGVRGVFKKDSQGPNQN